MQQSWQPFLLVNGEKIVGLPNSIFVKKNSQIQTSESLAKYFENLFFVDLRKVSGVSVELETK